MRRVWTSHLERWRHEKESDTALGRRARVWAPALFAGIGLLIATLVWAAGSSVTQVVLAFLLFSGVPTILFYLPSRDDTDREANDS